MPDPHTIPFKEASGNGHYESKQLPQDRGDFLTALGLPEFAGDVVSANAAGTVGGEVATFWGTDGHTIKAANQTGLAKLTTGVLATVAAPTGAIVGTTDVQTLTNKRLEGADLFGVTGLTKADVGLSNVDNTSDANKPISSATSAALAAKENKAEKGVVNGYAGLDSSGKLPMSQVPDAIIGASRYQGTWNAATNSPAIPAAAPANNGYYYSVAVAGTTNINGIATWAVGDTIISNGSVWQKIPVSNAVQSVNGKTGIVTIDKNDVGLGSVDNTSDAAKNSAATTLSNKTIDGASNTLNVRLNTTDVSGNLPVNKLNAGTNASAATFWRGDGQWVSPTGAGDVTGASASVEGELPLYTGTSGKALKRCNLTGFVKASVNGAAVAQTQLGVSDIDSTIVSGQPAKATIDSGDYFLELDAVSGQLRKVQVLPKIWSVRARNYNAIGNPNFEIDQISAGTTTGGWGAQSGGNGYPLDRWATSFLTTPTTARFSFGQQTTGGPTFPGTSTPVGVAYERLTLTTQQASLAAGDWLSLQHSVEGPAMRELLGGTHSVSLMVRSSVANLKFSITLRNGSGPNRTLAQLCTLGAANTWTLFSFPNLPVWDAGGTWSTVPGAIGYIFNITVGAGSTMLTATQGSWVSGSFLGVTGMDNFAAAAVNSTFDFGFVQHEPGPECSTLMDIPWIDNLQGCQRYYSKSYDYAIKPGVVSGSGCRFMILFTGYNFVAVPVSFPVRMAKVPAVNIYCAETGAKGVIRDYNGPFDRTVSSVAGLGEMGYAQINMTTTTTAATFLGWQWVADCAF